MTVQDARQLYFQSGLCLGAQKKGSQEGQIAPSWRGIARQPPTRPRPAPPAGPPVQHPAPRRCEPGAPDAEAWCVRLCYTPYSITEVELASKLGRAPYEWLLFGDVETFLYCRTEADRETILKWSAWTYPFFEISAQVWPPETHLNTPGDQFLRSELDALRRRCSQLERALDVMSQGSSMPSTPNTTSIQSIGQPQPPSFLPPQPTPPPPPPPPSDGPNLETKAEAPSAVGNGLSAGAPPVQPPGQPRSPCACHCDGPATLPQQPAEVPSPAASSPTLPKQPSTEALAEEAVDSQAPGPSDRDRVATKIQTTIRGFLARNVVNSRVVAKRTSLRETMEHENFVDSVCAIQKLFRGGSSRVLNAARPVNGLQALHTALLAKSADSGSEGPPAPEVPAEAPMPSSDIRRRLSPDFQFVSTAKPLQAPSSEVTASVTHTEKAAPLVAEGTGPEGPLRATRDFEMEERQMLQRLRDLEVKGMLRVESTQRKELLQMERQARVDLFKTLVLSAPIGHPTGFRRQVPVAWAERRTPGMILAPSARTSASDDTRLCAIEGA